MNSAVRLLCLFPMLMTCCLAPGFAGPLDETRYCTVEPLRNWDGTIARRSDVLRVFKKLHPCPATGNEDGACPGWNIDHVIPLACGGCDEVSNLQWLPVEIKRCAGDKCKDRWERKIYCGDW